MADFPSPTSAYGVWSLNEIRNAIRGSNWPVVAPTDPDFANVSLLLHGDGTNGAQNNTFLDSSANGFTITRNGNATQGSFSPYSVSGPYDPSTHGGSGYFDGTGDYLAVASDNTIPEGNEPYTIEAWIYPRSLSNRNHIVAWGDEATNQANAFRINVAGNGLLNYWWTNDLDTGDIGLTANRWYHVAATFDGTTRRIFLDGVIKASDTPTGHNVVTTNNLRVGRGIGSVVNEFDGFMSDVRIVNSALYTSSFTPPTAPLPVVANTSFLCNFDNAGIFDSTGKNVIETVGNAQIDTTTVKYGTGAMEFDGTGDWLFVPGQEIFEFGTGDWTVEAWVNIGTSLDSYGRIVECGAYNDSNTWRINYNNANASLIFQISNSSGTRTSIQTTTTGSNEWRHYAVTRSGNTIRMFVNGVQEGGDLTFTDSLKAPTQLGGLSIGVGLNGVSNGTSIENYHKGFLDDLRITKGVARYTANFTPPTEAFPDQ